MLFFPNIKSEFTFENFKIFAIRNIWNNNFRKSRVLPDKLIAMVTPDNLGNQKNIFDAP